MTTKKWIPIDLEPGALRADRDLTTRVRRAIASSLAGGDPTIAKVAKAVDMSARTLQRRLLCAGLTYSRLLDEVRFEAAIRLLILSDMSLREIARALGYSDLAHFSRAFKRWSGQTPSEFR